MTADPSVAKPPSVNEEIKAESHLLRGTIAQDMADTSTGAISEPNSQLTKFHGLYLQDDRDLRNALKKAGQEKAFAFMLRVRLPGGRATPQQWLALDRLAGEVASPSLRLTTRQTFQFHGVLKGNVKPLIRRTSEPGPETPPPMNVFLTSLRVPHALTVTLRQSSMLARIRLMAVIAV